MDYITYSLMNKTINSNQYYMKVEALSAKIISNVLTLSECYLNDFIIFISEHKLDKIRSKEEYAIELLLIGVL